MLLRERAAGRVPEAAIRVLAGWIGHLRTGQVDDVRAAELGPLAASVPRILDALDPALGGDEELVAAVGALL